MKKFYYLDKNKKWKGPYQYLHMLFLALIGKINPRTYVWHNKLAADIGSHPTNSIYARLKAWEYRTFPVWVFGDNLKILAINSLKTLRKKISRSEWEKFVSRPIETPAADAVMLTVIPTLTAIHDFAAPGNFKVKLIYIDISGDKDEVKAVEFPIRLEFDNSLGIKYEVTMEEPPNVGGVYHQESYGLHRHLCLTSDADSIEIARNSSFDFSTKFPYKPQILSGRFRQANLISETEYKQCYNRLVIKTDDKEYIGPLSPLNHTGTHWFDHEKFNIVETVMGVPFRQSGAHVDIGFSGESYRLYSIPAEILAIDGLSRQDLADFKKHAEVIRTALALLTGKFYGGEASYVAATDPHFKSIDGIWYELGKATVISSRQIIDLRLFRMTFKANDEDYKEKYHAIDTGFDPAIFAELCRALDESESLMHAAALVITAMGNSDPLQQGASYAVALETLTTELGERKSKELKPIGDRAVAKALTEEMHKVIVKFDADLSEDAKVILGKKVDSINSPTNRDKLVKTFAIYGLTLSPEDVATIDKRNDYLHGKNPLTNAQQFELTQISLRLHTLIVSLILKVVGYGGHVINLDKRVYATNEEKLFEIMLTVETEVQSLTEKLTLALTDGKMDEAERIKLQIIHTLQNSDLNQVVRII